ncbi:MAG: TonB-dependent receptor [Proteobacteria bacterium]|nr:TonB-dependent receptor [Pseudomonadota bacterium]
MQLNVFARRSLASMTVALLAGSAALSVRAQEATTSSDVLEEVVVTAQKREESLQRVPVSVTALTSTQLGSMKLDSPSTLTAEVPNLQVNGIVGEGSPLFSLRGVSMFDYSLSQSSPVASYLDEVYKGNFVLFGVEMYDLERIEVLRGPQGTLYGKNTTGGAINFITKKPGFDTEGNIKLGVGNYNRREASGAFQTAIVPDRLAARFAFTYTKADGFIKNVLPGHPDMEGVDQYGVRLSLLYKATDSLDLILRLATSKQNPYNYAIIAGRIGADGIGGVGYYRTSDGTATGTPLADDQVAQNYTPRRRQENKSASLTAKWAMSDRYALTSITSWDQGQLFNPEGTDGAPLDIWKIPYFGKTRQVTQDLRLSTTGNDALSFIFGAYYQHEVIFNSTENRIFNFLDYNGDGAINYHDCVDSSYTNPSAVPGFGYVNGAFINLTCNYYNQFDQIRNSWALYSDGSYAFNDQFKLRAGLRFNHDNAAQKNAIDQLRGPDEVPIASIFNDGQCIAGDPTIVCPLLTLPGSPGYAAAVNTSRNQSAHNTDFTGRLGFDYTPTTDSLIYLNLSRGYRSAAFNAQFLFTPTDFTTVKPETLDAAEVGFKSTWLGNRLQFNGAFFHYQYKNQQIVNVYPNGQQPLINLGKSKIDGAELELVTRPARDLTLRAGLGILKTKVQEGVLASGDISGNELPNAPKVSGTLSADWDAWHSDALALTWHVDASFTGRQFLALPNESAITQDSYHLLNSRITLHGPDSKWEVGIWGNNLADKFYLTNAVDVQGFGFDYRHRGLPRMYGIDATYRF